jgi:hypothetical protein
MTLTDQRSASKPHTLNVSLQSCFTSCALQAPGYTQQLRNKITLCLSAAMPQYYSTQL